MKTRNLKLRFNIKSLILILGVVFILSLASSIWLIQENRSSDRLLPGLVNPLSMKSVSAEEIYPLFFCPCCGEPLDKNNICCAEAQERIAYIDSLTAAGESENAIILAYAKKYGIDSFVDKNKQEEIKAWLVESAPRERPIIGLNPSFYDFGDVSQAKGIVATFFELKNEGENDLIINKLDSSCGCTSASIIFKGEEGPRFAMAGHGIENPTGWEITIAPGESAQLKVYYDPNIHQSFRGPATREILIYSSDPIDFEKKVQIELNQID